MICGKTKRKCGCGTSTGIHEAQDANGSAERPWGLTFGSGMLDEDGYWQYGCAKCARRHEKKDGVPLNSYWPFEKNLE